MNGLLTYFTTETFTPLEMAAGVLSLVVSLLAVAGVHLTGQHMQALLQSEGQSRQANTFFRAIFDHLPDPVVFKDREELYQAANPAFQSFLGKDSPDILGKKRYGFPPPSPGQRYPAD